MEGSLLAGMSWRKRPIYIVRINCRRTHCCWRFCHCRGCLVVAAPVYAHPRVLRQLLSVTGEEPAARHQARQAGSCPAFDALERTGPRRVCGGGHWAGKVGGDWRGIEHQSARLHVVGVVKIPAAGRAIAQAEQQDVQVCVATPCRSRTRPCSSLMVCRASSRLERRQVASRVAIADRSAAISGPMVADG